MFVLSAAFLALRLFPANFEYLWFAVALFVIGASFGAFAAPNTTSVMNSLPPAYRGVGSGMRSTFQFAGNPLSLSVYFTVMVLALSLSLPTTIRAGLEQNGVPEQAIQNVVNLPPTGALFAVFLGYNPMQTLLPAPVLDQLKPDAKANLLSTTFFLNTISSSCMDALRAVFLFSAILTLFAGVLSALRGKRFVYEESADAQRVNIDAALQRQPLASAQGSK
jgi:hypothetical protein